MKNLSRLMVVAASSTLGWSLCHGQAALGGNAGGQRRGGISYVTRRVPMAVPNQIAGGYFAAAGVPVGGGGGTAQGGFNAPGVTPIGGVPFASGERTNPGNGIEGDAASLSPAARQALQVLARNGDKEARATLSQFAGPRGGAALPTPEATSAPESE